MYRVVAGMVDPDPRTAGGGLKRLADAGIDVVVGIEGSSCRALNAPFVHRIIAGHRSGVYGVLSCALSSSSSSASSSSGELDEPTAELVIPVSHKVSSCSY
jgi:diaminohydroxyphosphoribosylaminopyrimidine deaminase / 5-amino-6-(5-phosphoribosylamino)uracil reductase